MKRETVMTYIQRLGEGAVINTDWVHRCALDCECSAGTVYRAMRDMRSEGSMTGNKYTGRKYITPEELVPHLDREYGTFINDEWYARLSLLYRTDQRSLYQCLIWAIQRGYIQQLNGGRYGWLLRPSLNQCAA